MPLIPLAAAALSAVQMIVLLSDEEVAAGAHRRLRERDDGHPSMRHGGINQAFYADTPRPELDVKACCGPAGSLHPENRLEMTFPSVLAHAPPGVHWFIFTEGDSWWHFHNLAAEVKRVEEAVHPASPSEDFLVVGGGGFLVSSSFMILSKPAVEYFANPTTLDECRQRLLRCDPFPKSLRMIHEVAM